jgi:hypothetical protein
MLNVTTPGQGDPRPNFGVDGWRTFPEASEVVDADVTVEIVDGTTVKTIFEVTVDTLKPGFNEGEKLKIPGFAAFKNREDEFTLGFTIPLTVGETRTLEFEGNVPPGEGQLRITTPTDLGLWVAWDTVTGEVWNPQTRNRRSLVALGAAAGAAGILLA